MCCSIMFRNVTRFRPLVLESAVIVGIPAVYMLRSAKVLMNWD